MAATPEELLGLVEPAPPSPSVFLDLPPTPHSDSQQPQDDLALEYISRMLMEEEDIVDKLFYQYPDHPTLLQAQQPFAEILSTSGTTTADAQEPSAVSALLPGQGSIMHIENPAFFNGTYTVEPNSSLSPTGMGSTSIHVISSMAFFKGTEEANRFLPIENWTIDGRGRKNRFNGRYGETEAGMGRSRKQTAVLVQPEPDSELEEETAAQEMLDRLMLNGYTMCPREMQEVGITLEKEKEKEATQQSICAKALLRRRGTRQLVVSDLETLLIRCAEAVAASDKHSARELLEQIKRHSSPTGDAMQRVAHYFAEGLEARLTGTGSQLYRSFMAKGTSAVEHLKAKNMYTDPFCFLKLSFLLANKTIYKAVAGRKKLHVVDYGVNDGFQWPDLLRWLADREGGPPEVRITGINSPQPGFHRAKRTEEAGHRLSQCASQLGVPFKFRAITAKLESIRVEDLDINPDEVLVVNSMFHFSTLMDESLAVCRVNPRDLVLNTIRKMKPSVFVHGVVNGSYSAAFFMTRFRQALYNFTAHFDLLEATMQQDDKRLLVEKDIFARSAMNIIACEGADRVERPQNYKEWEARHQRAGLRQLPLDHKFVQMLKDKVKQQYHRHFMINEDRQWLLQGWKGRVLYALSTWVADDASSPNLA